MIQFFSRPRRFGKSLLVSTFESLFSKGLEDFKGLEIENLWKEDRIYQVIRFDFSSYARNNAETFGKVFADFLTRYLKPLGLEMDNKDPEDVLNALSLWLKQQIPYSLVLLIDEYDSPLTRLLNRSDDFDKARDLLSQF